MKASRIVGVPYSDEDIAKAVDADLKTQVEPGQPGRRGVPAALSQGATAQVQRGNRPK